MLVDAATLELPSPRDPMAVARRFVSDRYERDDLLHLRRWRGGWWLWRTAHWAEIDEAKVRADAYAYTERAIYLNTSKKIATFAPWARNRHRIADLLEALGAICHLPDDLQPPVWLEVVPERPPATKLVAVENGLLHVPTRSLSSHDARLFNTVSVPFASVTNAPEPVKWLTFLNKLWPNDSDSIAALQEFFGYVISGRTDLHKILLLVGPTRAGKGVIARVLEALVGRGNYAGPTLASLGANFGLQPLIGKPLAVISDARLGGANVHQVVERLLSISGEDMLTIDRKYREPWTGTLPTRFVLVSNELPRFGDASGAIANRFVVLNLTQSWLGRENTQLTLELLTELPGILAWALDGLDRLTTRRCFTEPAASRDATAALQDLVSPVAAFVRERCERGPYDVECSKVFAEWRAWAEDNGHRPGSLQTFGRDLRAVVPGLAVVRPRDGSRDGQDRPRCYVGLRLVGMAATVGSIVDHRGPAGSGEEPVRGGPRPGPLFLHVTDEEVIG